MFEKRIYIEVISGLFVIGFIFLSSCERRSTSYSDSMPIDFNFISSFADSSYILDTYKNTLTKTIDWGLDTTISYELPIKEKQKIYKLLKEIDIYKYPENYAPTSTVVVLPAYTYQFEFTINGVDYKISWKENTESEIKDARNLRKLFFEINQILENDELIKKLPESKRAFL